MFQRMVNGIVVCTRMTENIVCNHLVLNAELARSLVGLDPVVLPRRLLLICPILNRKSNFGPLYKN